MAKSVLNDHLGSSNDLCYMSLVMRKPCFCICENKDADQLRGNREADQRLCFRYTDSTITLLSESKISSLQPYSVIAQPGFVSDMVGNPEDRFSHNEAHIVKEIEVYMNFLLPGCITYSRFTI